MSLDMIGAERYIMGRAAREPVSTFIGLTALIESQIGIFTFIGGASAAGLIGGTLVTGAPCVGRSMRMGKL